MAYTAADRRMHIMELQRYLYAISLFDETQPKVMADGIYGRETAIAVRSFQQKHGLRPNGETNRATWDAIVECYRKNVQRNTAELMVFRKEREVLGAGENGFAVLVVQSILKTLRLRYENAGELQVTGMYDGATQRAVEAFQRMTGQQPTGLVDRETWNLMAAAIQSEPC